MAGVADGGEHIGNLELQMHRHGAATRSISVLNSIGARFTDSNEQVSDRTRRGTDPRQRIATRTSLSDSGNAGTTRSNGPISPPSSRRTAT